MLGLVLEGGGAKGSFHAGALKALFERGYRFDGVAGTSIGAINGALVAQGDFERCYEMWTTVTPSQVLDVDDEKIKKLVNSDFDRETILYFLKFLRTAVANRGLSMDKAQEFLGRYIDEKKLRASPIDFCLITVSITDDWMPVELFKEDVPEGQLKDYIIASAYYPAFKSRLINGKRFMDGGIYDNMPVNPLIRRGYTDIIAIRTMSNMPHRKVVDKSVNVDYITPSEPLGNTLSFTRESIDHNLKLGYFDALRFIDNLYGKRYYLKNMTDGEFIAALESGYGIEFYKELAKLLDARGNKRQLIQKMIEVIDREQNESFSAYQSFISFLEPFAEMYGIERFRVYGMKEFIHFIKNEYQQTSRVNVERSKDINATLQQIFYLLIENTMEGE